VVRSLDRSGHVTRRVSALNSTANIQPNHQMEALNSRLESFAKARRVKHSTTKRTLSLKWPHPAHFIATPDTLAEAGFFFNPSWDARDNVECFFCGKCLDGWEEQDDPFAIHWDKCRDSCAWAVVRCGLNEDLDRKGECVSPFHVALAHILTTTS
jgi:hypothetical protein